MSWVVNDKSSERIYYMLSRILHTTLLTTYTHTYTHTQTHGHLLTVPILYWLRLSFAACFFLFSGLSIYVLSLYCILYCNKKTRTSRPLNIRVNIYVSEYRQTYLIIQQLYYDRDKTTGRQDHRTTGPQDHRMVRRCCVHVVWRMTLWSYEYKNTIPI